MVAYGVERRTREIGIRVALGARQADVLRAIMGETLVLVGVGALGLILAVVSTRLLDSLLFGFSSADPATLVGVLAFLLTVAVSAMYPPARRATQFDPTTALRHE